MTNYIFAGLFIVSSGIMIGHNLESLRSELHETVRYDIKSAPVPVITIPEVVIVATDEDLCCIDAVCECSEVYGLAWEKTHE